LASVVLLTAPTFVLADEYWSETFFISGDHITLPYENFDYFSFQIPPNTKAELYQKGRWRPIEKENEREPSSITSELIEWNRGEPGVIRFSRNIPKQITIDFSRIDLKSELSGKIYASTSIGSGAKIFSRTDWGADENWRYNGKAGLEPEVSERESGRKLSAKEESCINAQKKYPDEYEIKRIQKTEAGQNLIWPYQYSKRIQKIVVHHTAETGVKNGKTASQVMRAIYRYHTVSRKWGDIGYHFVIAPDGKIFEGRAGGDFVVAGHAYCNNIGTIGIALMGNFNNQEPSDEQVDSLRNLLLYLAKKYELDLTDEEWYHGKKTSNLIGHRDITATACPGENMYTLLHSLRKGLGSSKEIRYAQSQKIDGEPRSSLPVITLRPGEDHDIHLSFTNTGSTPWTNATWLFVQAGNGIKVRSVSNSKSYVAAKQKEKQVMPGETAHFTATIEAGYKSGLQTISLVPVVKDKRVKNAETLQVVEIEKPSWEGKLEKVRTAPKNPVTGKSTSISVDIRNTGDTLWKKNRIFLLITAQGTRKNLKLPLKKNTASGNIATFTGRFPSFYTAGDVNLRIQLMNKEKKLPIIFQKKISIIESKNKAEIQYFTEKLIVAKAGTDFSREMYLKMLAIQNGIKMILN